MEVQLRHSFKNNFLSLWHYIKKKKKTQYDSLCVDCSRQLLFLMDGSKVETH